MTTEPKAPTQMRRSTGALVDTLFSVIDKLNAKEIDAETARAVSHTAKTIVSVANLELDYRRFMAENKENKGLGTLTIDAPKPE